MSVCANIALLERPVEDRQATWRRRGLSSVNMMTKCEVERRHERGLHVVATHRGELVEWFVLAYPLPGEEPGAVFTRAARALADREAVILNHFVWHLPGLRETAYRAWECVLGPTTWPVSWMIDRSGRAPFAGVTIRAVSGIAVKPVHVRDRLVGATYETRHARYLLLGDLHDPDAAHSRPDQARRVMEDMLAGLDKVGMDFSNVIRTWFFNEDILDWYDEFNRTRTAFFHEHGVFSHVVPASTGIGTANIHGSALISSLVAAKGKSDAFSFYSVPSPLQDAATDYGSSFSRAVEVATPDRRHLLVSGTASIDADGNSVHVGDATTQVHLTLDVIGAILESRGMSWKDAIEGLGYVRFRHDGERVMDCLRERGLQDLPLILSENTVCRDELLFELELQAAVSM